MKKFPDKCDRENPAEKSFLIETTKQTEAYRTTLAVQVLFLQQLHS